MNKIVDFDEKMNNFFFELQCHSSLIALEYITPIITHADKLSSQFFQS
jgi:hypothetical protein